MVLAESFYRALRNHPIPRSPVLETAIRQLRAALPSTSSYAKQIIEPSSFTRLPESQWKSARTTNAIERLHEEFKRHIKTQTVLPSAETAAMLFWALLASGQIIMRKVDGWQTLPEKLIPRCIDLAA